MHLRSGDNNLVQFHLWWRVKKVLKSEKIHKLSSPLPNYTVTEVNNGFQKKEPILYFAANQDREQGKTWTLIPWSLFLEKLKTMETSKMSIQGNNPHIFLWHLYNQKQKKIIFKTQRIMNLIHIKIMPLKSQAKTKPSFRNTHFITTF